MRYIDIQHLTIVIAVQGKSMVILSININRENCINLANEMVRYIHYL